MHSAKGSVWGECPGLARRCAALLLCLSVCNAAWTTDLQVRVLQQDGKPLPGAVVTVHVIAASAAAPAPIKAVMDQLDLAFVPALRFNGELYQQRQGQPRGLFILRGA